MNAFRPPPLQAATAASPLQAALTYPALGFSVVPLSGKRPTVPWHTWQTRAAPEVVIRHWFAAGLLSNVGLVCGAASANLVVLDLDDPRGYTAFATTFPALVDTYTIATGSGKGKHLYFFTAHLPQTTRALSTPVGHLELRAQGCQIVAPPSRHPKTGRLYSVEQPAPIRYIDQWADLAQWIQSFVPTAPARPTTRAYQSPAAAAQHPSVLNPRVVEALTTTFLALGFKRHQAWLNGPCLCTSRHCHQDSHPSFGFNTQSGYGYCFVCGTFLAKDLCPLLDIDPRLLGGLLTPTAAT